MSLIREFKIAIKWAWREIDWRNWTMEGRKMANPFTIIRRLVFLIPLKLAKWLYIVLMALGWGIADARQLKNWLD